MKNWLGEPSHPTDSYIHWTTPHNTAKVLMGDYRRDYTLLAELGEAYETALKNLLEVAYQAGRQDERDSNNPDI